MGLSAQAKHLLHVVAFISWLLLFEIISGGIRWRPTDEQEIDPIARARCACPGIPAATPSVTPFQLGAERKVTFDHGKDGSIAEDCYFSMIAFRDGYTFDFIEGEMHEKSPFTFWDFLQQRKRWLQGIFLTVHSREIPIKNKDDSTCAPWRLVMYTVGALLTIPFNIWIENLAVLWGMIGQKHQFYVVKKDWQVLDV
uniref:Glycosyltransferase 2-like domain-containing protein n=1 Tax=Plectus sambesii TaxID=2011161 RepID=A0A914WTH8_9BILA